MIKTEWYREVPVYDRVEQKVSELKTNYNFLKAFSIGGNNSGRKLFTMGLGDLRNSVLFTAAFHEFEWFTTLLCVRFIEECCLAHKARKKFYGIDTEIILNNRGLIVIPLVNPDGAEIPPGNCVKPVLEREIKAIANLCTGFDVKRIIAFYTRGENIYYHDEKGIQKNTKIIAEAMGYKCGYRVCESREIFSYENFKNCFIKKMRKPGFTIEVGAVENLLIEKFETVYEQLAEMMLISVLL